MHQQSPRSRESKSKLVEFELKENLYRFGYAPTKKNVRFLNVWFFHSIYRLKFTKSPLSDFKCQNLISEHISIDKTVDLIWKINNKSNQSTFSMLSYSFIFLIIK